MIAHTRSQIDRCAFQAFAADFFDGCRTAAGSLPIDLQKSFVEFEAQWRDFFGLDGLPNEIEYRSLPVTVRRRQFERFERACRVWDEVVDVLSPGSALGAHTRGGQRRDGIHGRISENRLRHAELHQLYGDVDALFGRSLSDSLERAELESHRAELGVGHAASVGEIRLQYRRLSKMHHPDRSGDSGRMKKLNVAYRALVAHLSLASA